MAQLSITLRAGVPKRQTFGFARFLTLQSLGDAALVDVAIEVAGFSQESLRGLQARDRIVVGDSGFEAATFTAATDCTIEVIASLIDVRLNNNEGQTVLANIVGTVPVQVTGPDPLPVANDRGDAPANPVYVTGLTLAETPANTVTDAAAIAASPVAAALLAADATRLEMVIFNQGPSAVAIGMAGITWAKRAIVLNAGDTWIEQRAAAKAWQVITDAGGAANVTVQERKA